MAKLCRIPLPDDAKQSVFVCVLYADTKGRLSLAFQKRRADVPLAMVQTVLIPALSNLTEDDLVAANLADEELGDAPRH